MARTLTLSRDLKLLEKHCGTTAGKIRAKIKQREQQQRQREQQQRQREQQQRQREQQRQRKQQQRMTAKAKSFQEAQQKEPSLTLGEYHADLFLKDLAAGKVKFAPLHTEEKGPPVTASEHTATTGGRKTRRKRRRKKKKSRRKRKTRHRRKRRKTRKKRR